MLTAIAIITAAAAIGSFIFSGWQSREVARQTRLNNQVAATATLRDAVRHLDDTIALFLQHPEQRQYFYDGVAAPTDPIQLARTKTLAELLADCLDSTLYMADQLPSFREPAGDWEKTARHMFKQSPVLRATVREATWWPDLAELLPVEAATADDN